MLQVMKRYYLADLAAFPTEPGAESGDFSEGQNKAGGHSVKV